MAGGMIWILCMDGLGESIGGEVAGDGDAGAVVIQDKVAEEECAGFDFVGVFVGEVFERADSIGAAGEIFFIGGGGKWFVVGLVIIEERAEPFFFARCDIGASSEFVVGPLDVDFGEAGVGFVREGEAPEGHGI